MKKLHLQILFLCIILIGCNKEDNTQKKFYTLSQISTTTYDKNNAGLHDDFIVKVVMDKNDNIWIGTFAKGIAKFDGANFHVYNTQNSGLSNDSIWDMVFDNQNNLWIATMNGLSKFDGVNWATFNMKNSNLPVKFISTVAVDKDNIVWLGCGNAEEGGLMKFDGVNWELYTTENSSLPCRIINKIFIDKNNNKWIATNVFQGNGGIVKIDGNNWTVFNKNNTIMPLNCAEEITQDMDGNIWVASASYFFEESESSLLRYDGKNWEVFKPNNSTQNKLTNRITCLKADMYNNIWIATSPEPGQQPNYEITMFNGKEWFVLSDFDSTFPHTYVKDMLFDKNNILWIGQTGFGLMKTIITLK